MSAQHVLIVEDSLVYRRLLSRMLTQWGYIVSEAENGVAALAILENQPVSLVISDWEMPEMNGLTLCREVRRRQFGHYVYLILLTAREDPGDLTQGFAAGADDFLSKPVEQSELRARLHAGARILSLEADLAARNARLSEALRQIEQDLELAARIQQSVLPAHQLCYQGFSPTGFSCRRPGYRGIFLMFSRWGASRILLRGCLRARRGGGDDVACRRPPVSAWQGG
jgi:sigma-B regulation protein RsbU (phosphoserine phosphatase)